MQVRVPGQGSNARNPCLPLAVAQEASRVGGRRYRVSPIRHGGSVKRTDEENERQTHA